ncbi:MAG: hypothetical protein IIB77_09825, partial [Proteobacteria bacterium]|nr:hypothetical protein [Pseudomonadota bacterium]
LDGAIDDVNGFDLGGRLDLDRPPGAVDRNQYIDPDQHAVVLKCCLEDREVGTAVQELRCLADHQAHLAIERNLDGVSGTVNILRDGADLVAGGEQRLGVCRDLAELRMVFFQV